MSTLLIKRNSHWQRKICPQNILHSKKIETDPKKRDELSGTID